MNNLIKKILNREAIVYTVFGVLTTVVDFLIFGLLYYVSGLGEIVSNTSAWVVAVLFAFVTNKIFVFKAKNFAFKNILRELTAFIMARVTTLLLTNVFLLFAGYIGMNMMLAKALISVAVIILNYIFSKLFIFKKTNQKPERNQT